MPDIVAIDELYKALQDTGSSVKKTESPEPYDPYITLEPLEFPYDPENPSYDATPKVGTVVGNFEAHLLEKIGRLTCAINYLAGRSQD